MAKRLASGELRHPVRIYQHKIDAGTTAYDSYGQVAASSTGWTELVRRRAKIEQLGGQEAEIARQLYPQASYKITLDYDQTIASTGGARKMVLFNGRMMFIGAVLNPDLENVQLELLCGEER